MFVLKAVDTTLEEYYAGDTYRFEGGYYASTVENIEEAKTYTSEKRAINAAEALRKKVQNYIFEVEEVKDEGYLLKDNHDPALLKAQQDIKMLEKTLIELLDEKAKLVRENNYLREQLAGRTLDEKQQRLVQLAKSILDEIDRN